MLRFTDENTTGIDKLTLIRMNDELLLAICKPENLSLPYPQMLAREKELFDEILRKNIPLVTAPGGVGEAAAVFVAEAVN